MRGRPIAEITDKRSLTDAEKMASAGLPLFRERRGLGSGFTDRIVGRRNFDRRPYGKLWVIRALVNLLDWERNGDSHKGRRRD